MRVLVIRPEPMATATAERLAAMGHEPVVMPLFRLRFEPTAGTAARGPRAGVIFTSSNGVASISGPETAWEACYAVGQTTGRAARNAGWRDIRTGAGRAADLADLVVADVAEGRLATAPDRPLVYVAGATRRPDLEARLSDAGIALRTVVGYHMDELSYSTDFFQRPEIAAPVDAVLVHSAEAARRFSVLAATKDMAAATVGAIAVCLSAEVAGALGAEWSGRHKVATRPTENALLASLAALR